MKSENIVDSTTDLSLNKTNLNKIGKFSAFFYGFILLLLILLFYPSFIDGSFFRALGKISELPSYSLMLLTYFFTSILSVISSLLIYKSQKQGIYILFFSSAVWEFVLISSLIENGINVLEILLVICTVIILALVLKFWREEKQAHEQHSA